MELFLLTVLTNIRSTKVLWKDGHHPIITFSTLHKFGSQKFLPASNLAFKTFWSVPHSEFEKKYNSPHIFSRLTWAVPKKYSPLPNFFWSLPPETMKITRWRVYCILPEKLSLDPPLDSRSTTEPEPEMLSAVSTRNWICRCGKINAAIS